MLLQSSYAAAVCAGGVHELPLSPINARLHAWRYTGFLFLQAPSLTWLQLILWFWLLFPVQIPPCNLFCEGQVTGNTVGVFSSTTLSFPLSSPIGLIHVFVKKRLLLLCEDLFLVIILLVRPSQQLRKASCPRLFCDWRTTRWITCWRLWNPSSGVNKNWDVCHYMHWCPSPRP